MPNTEILVSMSEDIGYIRGRVDHLVETSKSDGERIDGIGHRLYKVESHQAWVKTLLSPLAFCLTLFLKAFSRGA